MVNKVYNIPQQIGHIFLNLLENKSWTVMWYIYMLIGLYILTPILRGFIKNEDSKTIAFILKILFIFCLVVPTINYCFNTSITDFYLKGFTYVFYYISGYYIYANCTTEHKRIFLIAGLIGLIGQSILLIFKNFYYNSEQLDTNSSCFVAMLSIVVFYIFKEHIKINNRAINFIAKYSFGIYLVHTFWLNLFTKFFKIYPDYFAIGIGELIFMIITLILSCITSMILYRIPLLKKLLN